MAGMAILRFIQASVQILMGHRVKLNTAPPDEIFVDSKITDSSSDLKISHIPAKVLDVNEAVRESLKDFKPTVRHVSDALVDEMIRAYKEAGIIKSDGSEFVFVKNVLNGVDAKTILSVGGATWSSRVIQNGVDSPLIRSPAWEHTAYRGIVNGVDSPLLKVSPELLYANGKSYTANDLDLSQISVAEVLTDSVVYTRPEVAPVSADAPELEIDHAIFDGSEITLDFAEVPEFVIDYSVICGSEFDLASAPLTPLEYDGQIWTAVFAGVRVDLGKQIQINADSKVWTDSLFEVVYVDSVTGEISEVEISMENHVSILSPDAETSEADKSILTSAQGEVHDASGVCAEADDSYSLHSFAEGQSVVKFDSMAEMELIMHQKSTANSGMGVDASGGDSYSMIQYGDADSSQGQEAEADASFTALCEADGDDAEAKIAEIDRAFIADHEVTADGAEAKMPEIDNAMLADAEADGDSADCELSEAEQGVAVDIVLEGESAVCNVIDFHSPINAGTLARMSFWIEPDVDGYTITIPQVFSGVQNLDVLEIDLESESVYFAQPIVANGIMELKYVSGATKNQYELEVG